MLRRLLILAAALGAAAGVTAAPAAAHPSLVQAAPAPGAAQPGAPRAITLAFNEKPIARGSDISVEGLETGPERLEGNSLTATFTSPPAPGVYEVTWTILGSDGHQTAGRFNFGVAGEDGAPPPGAERLSGAGGTGTGNQSADAQNALAVVARWLLIVAVSLLFGGALLARRAGPQETASWRRAAPLALILALTAATYGVLAAATAGAGEALDLGLVSRTEVGIAALVRLVVLVVGGLVAARLAESSRPRDLAYLTAGGLALAATAFDGHVASAESPGLAGLGQVAHTLTAGTWLGAIVCLAVIAKWGGAPVRAARKFARIAVAALAIAVATGLIAAFREVDAWYFLRWSGYGQAVIVKAILVLVAAGCGYAVYRGRRAMRYELAAVLVVAGLASLLAAIPQGRGQQLPALRGNLLPGPAFSTVLGPGGTPADLTLAPARAGANRLIIAAEGDSVSARLTESGSSRTVETDLTRNDEGLWVADVDLPSDGTWFGYVSIDGETPASPAALPVGVPDASGAPPVEVLAVADLSGPDARRCRDFLVGLQLGIGRLNLLGGLDGHRKVALLARDDGGDAGRARELVGGERTVALAGACGDAAGAAVDEASARGIPSVVGDPGVPAMRLADAYRPAGDPAAEAFASAQYVARSVTRQGNTGVRVIRLFRAQDATGERWESGWRAGLAGTGLELDVRDAQELLDADVQEVKDFVDRRKVLALGIDGPASLAPAIARAGGPANVGYAPSPMLASGRTFTERFLLEAGRPGRLGVIRGMIEVTPDSRDALAYNDTVRRVFPGISPTLQGIRGYVTGLALGAGVERGIEPADLRKALQRPDPFTDALASPWRTDATNLGSQRFTLFGPQFLSSTLIPVSKGGMAYSGTYFPDGAWTPLSSESYGPPLDQPPLEG